MPQYHEQVQPADGAASGLKLHVGCGRTILPGWINLDASALPGVDLQASHAAT